MNGKLMELFEKANQDPAVKSRLLADPERMLKEMGLEGKENAELVERLKRVGHFVEQVNEIINGKVFPRPDPVFYPLDLMQKNAALDLFKYLSFGPYINKKDWVFYPPEVLLKVEETIEKRLQITPAAVAARHR